MMQANGVRSTRDFELELNVALEGPGMAMGYSSSNQA